MVLKLLLIIGLLLQPLVSSACDPYSQPEEIFTILFSPTVSPGVVVLAAHMALLPGLLLPDAWESVSMSDSVAEAGEPDVQLFRATVPLFAFLADKLRDNIAGRIIINTSPILVRAFRDSLQSGSWQTLVLQLSVPVTGKVVVYRKTGKIEFIDEIDSTLNVTLTSAWPPVYFKHVRIWDNQGMIFAWPEEDISVSEGVMAAQ